MADPRPPTLPTATRIMLLSVWCTSGEEWHARLVAPDATTHEFASPFELARFLSQPLRRRVDDGTRRLR